MHEVGRGGARIVGLAASVCTSRMVAAWRSFSPFFSALVKGAVFVGAVLLVELADLL